VPDDSPTAPGHSQPRDDGRRPTPPFVPDHELLRRIGQGAYGEVWLARSVVGTLRAVKVVYRDAFTDARPYEREFQGIQKFEPLSRTHEGLVDVLQIGLNEQAGYFYYVMELADSVPSSEFRVPSSPVASPSDLQLGTRNSELETYIPRTLASDLKSLGRLPFSQCLRTALALADALEHLHQQGLIHRDIKPSNIIFVNGTAKLADIGLVTETGEGKSWVGTEGFMPPEGPGTAQGDVYSLGKVLYEISTGKDRQRFPEPLTALADLPDHSNWLEFNEVVTKACEGDPKKRYASAAELLKELRLLQVGESVRQHHALQRQLAQLKRGVIPVVAAIILGLVFWQQRQSAESRVAQLNAQAATNIANATRRELLLREIQMARQGARTNGWFDAGWEKLREFTGLQPDEKSRDDARTQAAACLNWPDAKLIDAHTNAGAFSLAFSPDGETLLCAGVTDKTGTNAARLWRLGVWQSSAAFPPGAPKTNAPNEITVLPVFGDAVAAWKGDGTPVLFQPGDSNNFVLREATNGQVLNNFPLAGNPRQGNEDHPVLALTPDARYAAASVTVAGGSDPLSPIGGEGRGEGSIANVPPQTTGRFAVWDTTTGRALFQTNEPASALAFSPDGRALAEGDGEGRVRVFSVPDFALLAEFTNARVRINCFAFTRDPIVPLHTGPLTNAWWLAIGDAGGTIRVWRTATREPLSTCRGSAYDVFALAFHVNGVILASAGRSEIHVWDASTGSRLLSLSSQLDFIRSIAFAPAGAFFCGANEQKFTPAFISCWQFDMHRGVEMFRGLATQVSRVWLSPDGQYLAALEHSWRLAVWEVRSGRLLRVFETPAGDTADNAAVAFTTNGQRLAFCTGSEARLWNIENGQTERGWTLPWGLGESMCFDQQGRLLLLRRESDRGKERPMRWCLRCLTADEDCPVLHRQLDLEEWRPEASALAQNGRYFAIWGRRGPDWEIRLFAGETGEQLHRFEYLNAGAKSPGIDPTGRWLLHDCRGGSILRLLPEWDPATPLSYRSAVSPDARLFASVVPGGYALLFGRTTNAPALTVRVDVRASDSASPVFSHDGKRVAWGLENGAVILVTPDEVRRRLEEVGVEVKVANS
jgi:WD40 repeat protein